MPNVGEASFTAISTIQRTLQEQSGGCASLEDAAQLAADSLYAEFPDSFALVRVYATVPFGQLPPARRTFVDKLAESKGVRDQVRDGTLVLSLLGTRGEVAGWSSAHESRGHLGIPLVSLDFIDAIPMVSRLLKELGVPLDWVTGSNTQVQTRNVGKLIGLFYVRDAATDLDQHGRKIITAQDFVATHRVKTVFGFGSAYLMTTTLLAVILFSHEDVDKQQAQRFSYLANSFTASTARLVSAGKIFSASA
jgi:hypothetical protein